MVINGILGTVVYIIATGEIGLLVEKIVDLIIGLVFLAGIVLIFIVGAQGDLGATLAVAAGLGAALTLLTMPLWPFSSVRRGEGRGSVEDMEEKLRQLTEANESLTQRLQHLEGELGVYTGPADSAL